MQNRIGIIVLSALITLVCVYQLSFTFVSRGIQEDMDVFAKKEVEKAKASGQSLDFDSLYKASVKAYKDSVWTQKVYMNYTYEDVKKFELNLGLDLQGGMHVTLIVSPVEIMNAMSGNSKDPAYLKSIEYAKTQSKVERRKFTELFYESFKSQKGEGKLWEVFLNSNNTTNITANSTDADILKIINDELDGAIDRSLIVLRSRIDKFGATSPVIQSVKTTGRIEIELPGVDDEERITNNLKAVAKLEFLEVWTPQEVFPYYESINKYLIANKKLVESTSSESKENLFTDDSTKTDGELFAGKADSTKKVAADTSKKDSQNPIVDYIRTDGYNFLASKRNYDKVQALFASSEIKSLLPPDMTLLWGIEAKKKTTTKEKTDDFVPVYFVKKGENRPAQLNGDVITDARQDFGDLGKVAVSMQMNPDGARIWERMTDANKGRQIAISLDDVVYSAPNVNEKIPSGSSSISGNFSVEEAQDLANILKAGKLPAPTEIERMVVVGPSLGKESIQHGVLSLAAGFALVIVFMIMYYSKGGVVANIALLFNVLFILGCLATPGVGAALTLPGIAGIVLTMGMAVDANVLIFERVREELRSGKSIAGALSSGYDKAFSSIIDSNATTLITALMLFIFGSGLVKGFAITLMIGIVCSFFSAVFITRLILENMNKKGKLTNDSFDTGLSKGRFQNLTLNFIGNRKKAYLFSLAVIVAGFAIMFVQGGLNLGVSFQGGRSYIVKFDQEVVAHEIKSELKNTFGEASTEVKTFDGANQVQITTSFMINQSGRDTDKKVHEKLMEGLQKYNSMHPTVMQTIVVGPTIADDIRNSSIISIVLSLIAIFLYIFVRFRKIAFSIGAIIALMHDVLVVIAIFSISRLVGFSLEIDEVFIAAILTVVGYSINDTVVVFDRVREYLEENPNQDEGAVINNSINNTISRTIMTSFTTAVVVVVLLLFGGEALRGFSFALFIGILFGTYSSIFIATPVAYDMLLASNKNRKKEIV